MRETEIPAAYNVFMLDVGDGHRIYVEESGNPNGLPIVNFHGGPGSRSKPEHRARYDQSRFRVILFDQRNCGQSTPLAVDDKASLHYNSPDYIVRDADAIRRHLKISQWHVCGNSWGSAMALHYALTYPQYALSLSLRALFLSRAEDWTWMATGAALLCPPALEAAQELCDAKAGLDLIKSLADVIITGPSDRALAATRALMGMESGLEILTPAPDDEPKKEKTDEQILNSGLLYANMINHHLFAPDWCFSAAAQTALKDIPASITHGQCDTSCLVKNVYDMQKAHPHIKIAIAPNAGHGVDLDGGYERLFTAAIATIA